MTERILWLMTHPNAKPKQFMEKFEVSYRTYKRDKAYIRDRLWCYEVILKV